MHHKRRRPKKQRAGCLMCKPWKANHARKSDRRIMDARADSAARQQGVKV